MKNKDGIEYTESGDVQLEGEKFTIIKLKQVHYVAGFMSKYILVPTKSLYREAEPNPE